MGMEKQTEYISFSLNVCEQLVKATGGASEIFYINGDLSPQEAKAKGFTGIDYNSRCSTNIRMGRRSTSLRSESKCLDDEQRRRPEKECATWE